MTLGYPTNVCGVSMSQVRVRVKVKATTVRLRFELYDECLAVLDSRTGSRTRT